MGTIRYGLYPASGVALMEVSYEASTSTLRGTKLTGNQFVRAGRVSWEVTPKGCKMVSSLWAGALLGVRVIVERDEARGERRRR